MPLQSHNPQGDPCKRCGEPKRNHRVEHKFKEGINFSCEWCGLSRDRHIKRDRTANRSPLGRNANVLRQIVAVETELRSIRRRIATLLKRKDKLEPLAVAECGEKEFQRWRAKHHIA